MDKSISSPESDDPIVERMSTVSSSWKAAGDQRAVFLSCYCMMTRNMLNALKQGEFHDPAWVHFLLNRFAEYYFDALEAYELQPASAPEVWRLTFAYAQEKDVWPLQNLLLGVNAHINFDLVLALVEVLQPDWPRLIPKQRSERFSDHCTVNLIIGRTIDAVQDQVLEPAMPEMQWIDTLFGRADEWLISRLISGWRERVWEDAVKLLDIQEPAGRTALIQRVEETALQRAQAIYEKRWLKIP